MLSVGPCCSWGALTVRAAAYRERVQAAVDEAGPGPRPTGWRVLLVVALGGALGALARHASELALPTPTGAFPLGILLVNVVGCFLIGALAATVHHPQAHPLLPPFVSIGLLGGFTTFSTYTVQVADLALRGQVGTAAGYLVATVALALLAVEVGLLAGRGVTECRRRPRQLRLVGPR